MDSRPQVIKTKFEDSENIGEEVINIERRGFVFHFIFENVEYSVRWYEDQPDTASFLRYYIDDSEFVFDHIPYKDMSFHYAITYLITEENIEEFYIHLDGEGLTKVDFKNLLVVDENL